MGSFRHVPAQFNWSDGGMTVVKPTVPAPRPAKKKPVASVTVPDDFDARVDLATLKVESALNSFLDVLENKVEAPVEESPIVSEEVVTPVEPKPEPQKDPLWETVQPLHVSGSPIYPDGRNITNPNHLLLFIGKGAEVRRTYTSSGWASKLFREDGKENPVPDDLVNGLISAGQLVEKRPGVFRGVF